MIIHANVATNMKHYIVTLLLFLFTILFVFIANIKSKQENCIVLTIPDIYYTSEFSRDTFPKIDSFTLDTIILTRTIKDRERKFAEEIIVNSIKTSRYKTGVLIDISKAKYNEFVKILDIFLKNNVKQICFDFQNNRIYYFSCLPPREFAFNRVWINDYYPFYDE